MKEQQPDNICTKIIDILHDNPEGLRYQDLFNMVKDETSIATFTKHLKEHLQQKNYVINVNSRYKWNPPLSTFPIDIAFEIDRDLTYSPMSTSEIKTKYQLEEDYLLPILKSLPFITFKNGKWQYDEDIRSFGKLQPAVLKIESETKEFIRNRKHLSYKEKAYLTFPYLQILHSHILAYSNSLAKNQVQTSWVGDLSLPPNWWKKYIPIARKVRELYDKKLKDIYTFAKENNYFFELLDFFLITAKAGQLYLTPYETDDDLYKIWKQKFDSLKPS